MNVPDEIWLQKRILHNIATEKDPEAAASGVDQVRYISEARFLEFAAQTQPPAEHIIQIISRAHRVGTIQNDEVIALTNLGRLFELDKDEGWVAIEIALPELAP